MAGLDRDSIQHRQQMHRISGLVADANRHDHLMVPIDGGLAVIALNPNVTTLEHVALRSAKSMENSDHHDPSSSMVRHIHRNSHNRNSTWLITTQASLSPKRS
jgi:hypothetical protein